MQLQVICNPLRAIHNNTRVTEDIIFKRTNNHLIYLRSNYKARLYQAIRNLCDLLLCLFTLHSKSSFAHSPDNMSVCPYDFPITSMTSQYY